MSKLAVKVVNHYLLLVASLLVILAVVQKGESSDVLSGQAETFLKLPREENTHKDFTLEKFDDIDTYIDSPLSSAFESKNCSSDRDCRPWYFCNNGKCKCGKDHNGIMLCEDSYVSAILSCHCISYKDNSTYIGPCIYRCANEYYGDKFDPVYSEVVFNKDEHRPVGDWVNNYSCFHLKRTGLLCGQCLDNHSTVAYSYDPKCIPCNEEDIVKNWLKYLAAAYLFLTVFFFIVFFFKVNVTSSSLHGFVFYCQTVAMPTNIRFILLTAREKPFYILPARILLSIYGIGNLDFFRTLYPEFCLNTSTLTTIALDYGIAIYPLVLIVISYVLIRLYERNFKPVVFLWKPFHTLFTCFRRNWNARTSAVDAYATLFLLSFSKVLNVTFDLLAPSTVYELNPSKKHYMVYNDGSIKFLSREHMLPYGILAIIFLTLYIIPPVMLLLLYPCRCCRKRLTSAGLDRQFLRTFVNAFQGCYKDGSEPGTKDYRYFAAFYLLVRILLFVVYGITLGTIFFAFAAAIFLLFTLLLITIQPYKKQYSHYTKIDATFLLLLVIMCTIFLGINIATVKGHNHIKTCFILAIIFGIVPFIYFAGVVIYTVHTQKGWDQQIINRFKAWRHGYREIAESDDDTSFPDRLLNPASYEDCNISVQAARSRVGSKSVIGTAY